MTEHDPSMGPPDPPKGIAEAWGVGGAGPGRPVRSVSRGDGTKDAALSSDERAVMDHILAAMQGIQDWGLQTNQMELAMAVHGLQAFVIQHMLQRLNPDEWGQWFDVRRRGPYPKEAERD